MSDEGLIFRNSEPVSRVAATAILDGGDPHLIAETLVALAMHESDGEWIEDTCWRMADHADPWVRGTAGLCLGHVARRFRSVRQKSWEVVRTLCDDPAVDGRPCDALEDLVMFAGPEPGG
jgi:hypothetical protein